jgi:hypothetical protein
VTAEHQRLQQARTGEVPWRKWGPYLSDRQWGTVREDCTTDGNAWGGFTHDQARSRAYRWGEDGLAGICDDHMRLCFAIALWNGRDPILKERLFGLANGEGNHGEDVKECYFHLDNLPTHSYMSLLYKYPQTPFPYEELVHVNRERSQLEPEFELLDTGVFDEDRYFDVLIEYAKESAEDLLIRVTCANRGPQPATLHVLPHLWFRNTWWREPHLPRPVLRAGQADGYGVILAHHTELGLRQLQCEGSAELLFTDNETNIERLSNLANLEPFVKDGIGRYIVQGEMTAVDPNRRGTKAAAVYVMTLAPGERRSVRMRFCAVSDPDQASADVDSCMRRFDAVFAQRRSEADDFHAALAPPSADYDARLILRRALAGLLWSKQVYIYDVSSWLADSARGSAAYRERANRNAMWPHVVATDVISVPDKWEYPWFAAWDLAFQTIALSFVDPDFASEQLELLLQERYSNPTGQIPASEWNFGDVNPPVHAWAALFTYRLQRQKRPEAALANLRRAFHALLLNFTWWVNRRDQTGRNVFEGGFLGLDNVGFLDRKTSCPAGGYLELSDGTGWMLLFTQNMLEMALELALQDPVYEDLAIKFYEHFVWLAAAMYRIGAHEGGMWDDKDGFFYDVMRFPTGSGIRLQVRAATGLLPLCAVTVYPEAVLHRLPRFVEAVRSFNSARSDLLMNINHPERAGVEGRHLLSVLDECKLRRVLQRMLDPQEFLSDFGVRSLSRAHEDHPYVFRVGADQYQVAYRPAESDSGLFGGNSNWRGPVWFPVNVLLIRALLQLYTYYGDDFLIECPTGSGQFTTLFGVGQILCTRLIRIFRRSTHGHRPVFGDAPRFRDDPHWQDLILFYECFHGNTGMGIGASHQTGWSAMVAALIQLHGDLSAQEARTDLGIVFEKMAGRIEAHIH